MVRCTYVIDSFRNNCWVCQLHQIKGVLILLKCLNWLCTKTSITNYAYRSWFFPWKSKKFLCQWFWLNHIGILYVKACLWIIFCFYFLGFYLCGSYWLLPLLSQNHASLICGFLRELFCFLKVANTELLDDSDISILIYWISSCRTRIFRKSLIILHYIGI